MPLPERQPFNNINNIRIYFPAFDHTGSQLPKIDVLPVIECCASKARLKIRHRNENERSLR